MNTIFVDLTLKGRGVDGGEMFVADNVASFTVDNAQQYAFVQAKLSEFLQSLGLAAVAKQASK